MKHCVECGSQLATKHLENEGDIPFCHDCEQFRFPIFNTAVSMIVLDETKQKSLLIKQYGRDNYILVAGYVTKGESAEETVVREVKEETNLDVIDMQFNKSEHFEKSNTLMLNFSCTVSNASSTKINEEVDHAAWFKLSDARKNIMDGSLAQRFLEAYFAKLV